MDKFLYHYNSDSTFQEQKESLADGAIAFCKESGMIRTHGQDYESVEWLELEKPLEFVAGDICLYNAEKDKLELVKVDDWSVEKYPTSNYTPIGVVVVPNTHTDDGTARVISLAAMDYNNPDNGNTNSHVNMAWGGYNNNILTLDNKTAIPYITNTNYAGIGSTQQLVGWYNGSGSVPEMSSDYYNNSYPNPFDEGTCFGRDYSALAPSPYLTGESKNEIYYSTANTNNMCTDMDGKGNTEKILAVDNDVSTDWQIASSIINNTSTSANIQPHTAAQCCWRYHTVRTSQGDWYLPSSGELGYLCARWKVINNSINKLVSLGVNALILPVGNNWLSSTENNHFSAIYLRFSSNSARLDSSHKYFSYYVRAFLSVTP